MSQTKKKLCTTSSRQQSLRSGMSGPHPGKPRPYSTGAVWRAASSGLEGFENFGRLEYRIQEGGHLPYEG